MYHLLLCRYVYFKIEKFRMAATDSFMNLNNNFTNIIGLKSDQEHMSENQISISLMVKEASQF